MLEHRQVDLELKEQRVARLEADLIAVQQAAESTNNLYQELTVLLWHTGCGPAL